jgi:hypothetical protein
VDWREGDQQDHAPQHGHADEGGLFEDAFGTKLSGDHNLPNLRKGPAPPPTRSGIPAPAKTGRAKIPAEIPAQTYRRNQLVLISIICFFSRDYQINQTFAGVCMGHPLIRGRGEGALDMTIDYFDPPRCDNRKSRDRQINSNWSIDRTAREQEVRIYRK